MNLKVWIVMGSIFGGLVVPVLAAAGQDAVLAQYKTRAIAADPAFAGFSAKRGKALYLSSNASGNPDTPSCSSCHTTSPLNAGKTRAGKTIDPMAVSLSPNRFSDVAKTEKWFGRNCKTVLGRDCTAQEKGDFIAYLSSL